MNLSAVILAGGQSRRMGRDKAWLEIDGQPLQARAVDLVQRLEAVYPKRWHALVLDCIAQSRLAARDFAGACLADHAVRSFTVAPDEAGCFTNWNTPHDAARAKTMRP
jgi:molybdopterin-guanine dinucleotide biosynthesis protein A